jgi:anti-sigma factor RsiW
VRAFRKCCAKTEGIDVAHSGYESQVDSLLDGELTPADARELEAHIARCPECTRFRDERLALRAAIAAGVPTFHAPDALRGRVRAALAAARIETASAESGAERTGAEPRARARARRFSLGDVWRPMALAASLVIVAVGSWNLALRQANRDRLADDVLASHVRSLMPGHLTDVPSSDQHTVKPWFNGKLDYSPPVNDLAAKGYPLLGGRLDYVNGRSVAVLTYGRRQHLINVFLWPTTQGQSDVPNARDRQGYHLRHWSTPDYTYWVASDLNSAELQDFVRLLQQADSEGAGPSPR